MATGTEKLDAQINEARSLLDIAMRDASSVQRIQDLKAYLHNLEEQRRAIDRSVFGSFAGYGELTVKNPSMHTILRLGPVTSTPGVHPGEAVFLSPDGKPLGKIENIQYDFTEKEPETVFLKELDAIK